MDNYELIFDDQIKNQINIKNRQQRRICRNNGNICKMWHRSDDDFLQEKYEILLNFTF